jgi:hypothetical protein
MSLIIDTIKQERQRIVFMIDKYENMMCGLPKGSLCERHVGKKTYYYLKYRDGVKVISEYVPADRADEVRSGIDKRRHAETMLQSLRQEKMIADRILGGSK